jgi:hypothetical protein
MTPAIFLANIINPGLEALESFGGPAPSVAAARFMLAIAMQESGPGLNARYQGSPNPTSGPAKGWWQFETAGCAGVLSHKACSQLCQLACEFYYIVPQSAPLARALEGHDVMAAICARLLILTEPHALPATQNEGWSQYLNLWRPGKPHPETWPLNWQTASDTLGY